VFQGEEGKELELELGLTISIKTTSRSATWTLSRTQGRALRPLRGLRPDRPAAEVEFSRSGWFLLRRGEAPKTQRFAMTARTTSIRPSAGEQEGGAVFLDWSTSVPADPAGRSAMQREVLDHHARRGTTAGPG